MNETNITILIIVVLLYFSVVFLIFYFGVFKPSWDLFRKCDNLEKRIREENDLESQWCELIDLNKFSWHRSTSNRIRELALMMEIKYNVEILKK